VTKFLVATAIVVMCAAGSSAHAQDPAPVLDARVEAALKTAKLGYTIDDGDFRLDYNVADGRSQRVWVASSTAKIADLEMRDVWSVAYRGTGVPSAALANRLLTENVRMVLGAWQVNQGKDEFLVVFSAPIPANADATTIQEVIEAVTVSADRIEMELTGKDAF
jgi:hypothetical protein